MLRRGRFCGNGTYGVVAKSNQITSSSVLIDHKIGVGSIVHNVVYTSQYYLRHFFRMFLFYGSMDLEILEVEKRLSLALKTTPLNIEYDWPIRCRDSLALPLGYGN